MNEQSHQTHRRSIPLWHRVVPIVLIASLIVSINELCKSSRANLYNSILLVVIVLILMTYWAYIRLFPLKAQDRAIRAEENFRHFVLTGKPLDNRLRTLQIVALRFAGDDEFPSLAKKAAEENLSQKQIKSLIKNWRADNYRV